MAQILIHQCRKCHKLHQILFYAGSEKQDLPYFQRKASEKGFSFWDGIAEDEIICDCGNDIDMNTILKNLANKLRAPSPKPPSPWLS